MTLRHDNDHVIKFELPGPAISSEFEEDDCLSAVALSGYLKQIPGVISNLFPIIQLL